MRSVWMVLVLLLLFVGTVNAKTADGLTPAEETVCDQIGLTGASWGLCNAYCEAMDCDSDNTKASDKACEQVSTAFSKKSGGMDMPCEWKEECPCYSEDDLFSIVILVDGDFNCESNANFATWNSTNPDIIAEFEVFADEGCWQNIPEDTHVEFAEITEVQTAACINIISQYCQP